MRTATSKTIRSEGSRREAFAGLGSAVSLDPLLCHTRVCMALGEVKLLPAALLDADDVPDVIQVVLHFDQSIQHIHKDCALLLSRARASLPVIWVMNAKSVL